MKGLDQFNQKRGFWAFWITTIGVIVMGLAFEVAGVIQSYMQRGLGMDFLTVQGFMRPWFAVVLFGGLGLFTGVILYIVDVLTLATKKSQRLMANGLWLMAITYKRSAVNHLL